MNPHTETHRREVESCVGRAIDVADAAAVNQAMTTTEESRRVTEVTYLGFVHGTLAALWRMRPRYRGVIVQVGSALAYRSIPLRAAYCAAKHAVHGFTESLRSELIHEGSKIHVTTVHLFAALALGYVNLRS